MATNNLKGLAKSWYNSLTRLNYNWVEWKAQLEQAFPTEVDYQKMLEKIIQRVKQPEEDMLTYYYYYYEKLALLNVFNFNNKLAVDLLIGGLQDVSLKAAAKAGRHQTPSSLLQFLKTLPKPEPIRKPADPKRKNFVKRIEKPYERNRLCDVIPAMSWVILLQDVPRKMRK